MTDTRTHRLRRFVVPPKLPEPISPAQVQNAEQRAADAQNRVADAITRFAGSMTFVYLHVLWFGAWIVFGVEDYPYGLLTMIVSLEAIFLSTFVMISQNRQAAVADHRAEMDYQVNVRAEAEICKLLTMVEALVAHHADPAAAESLEASRLENPPTA